VLIQIFQQLTVINAIIYYGPFIFKTVTATDYIFLLQGVTGIINMLATFPAIYLVDHFGRKRLLVSGSIGMCTCFVGVLILFAFFTTSAADTSSQDDLSVSFTNVAAGYAMVGLIYFFAVHFAYSWGPIGWILPAEIFPLKHRARGVSLTTAFNWFSNLLVAQFTPILLNSIRYWVFLIFIVSLVVMSLYVHWWVPETKNLSLEQMTQLFGKVDDYLLLDQTKSGQKNYAEGTTKAKQERQPLQSSPTQATYETLSEKS